MKKFFLFILVLTLTSSTIKDGLWEYLQMSKKELEVKFNKRSDSDELVVNRTTYHFKGETCIVIQTLDRNLINQSITKKFKKYRWGYRIITKEKSYYCAKINNVYYLWHQGDLNYKFSFLTNYEN